MNRYPTTKFCRADLMLYYIEKGCEMTSMYGDMWEQYYTTFGNELWQGNGTDFKIRI